MGDRAIARLSARGIVEVVRERLAEWETTHEVVGAVAANGLQGPGDGSDRTDQATPVMWRPPQPHEL
jgi:hypothetical protein